MSITTTPEVTVQFVERANGSQVAHLPGCRHTGRATVVHAPQTVAVDTLTRDFGGNIGVDFDPKKMADCLMTDLYRRR